MDAPFQYLIIHKGCKNRAGVLAVQAGHAAGEAIRNAPISDKTRICALEADSSQDLEQLSLELTAAGIHHAIIREPDEPWNGAATAIGTEPMDREKVRPLVSKFKLLK